MSIEGISALNGLLKASDPKVAKREEKAGSTSKSNTAESLVDRVEVSQTAVDELKAKVESIPDVRSEKVEELQQAVIDGAYDVPSEDIARAIFDELA